MGLSREGLGDKHCPLTWISSRASMNRGQCALAGGWNAPWQAGTGWPRHRLAHPAVHPYPSVACAQEEVGGAEQARPSPQRADGPSQLITAGWPDPRLKLGSSASIQEPCLQARHRETPGTGQQGFGLLQDTVSPRLQSGNGWLPGKCHLTREFGAIISESKGGRL